MRDRRSSRRFCGFACQVEFQYRTYIERWLAGLETGATQQAPAKAIRRYLKEQRGARCEECGWCEVNPATGRSPLHFDHIDGDAANNRPENLRILCPNHHALTPNFAALNVGRGRQWRRERYLRVRKPR